MNLFNLAKSGMNSANSALQVIGDNLNNAVTPGYSRRDTVLRESGGAAAPTGFYGYGVQVAGVQRGYDPLLNDQLRGANTRFAALTGRWQPLSAIDKLLGDTQANPSVALNEFYNALGAMEADPSAPAAREAAFKQLNALTWQFNQSSEHFSNLEKSSNRQIALSVDEINTTVRELARLNQQTAKISAQSGTPPADLLDRRDSLLDQLSGQIAIRVSEDRRSGRIEVTLKDGRPLVSGEQAWTLQAAASPDDASKTTVCWIDSNGQAVSLDERRMTGGKLGGLFAFRNSDLRDARNALNQIALNMAGRFNQVHRQGFDPQGEPGGDLFRFSAPQVLANSNNHGNAALTAQLTTPYADVQAEDYSLTFTADGWQVKAADGRVVPHSVSQAGELQFAGLTLTISGTAQSGDRFMLNPAAGVAGSLQVAIGSADAIATSGSADPDETKNNENLLALAAIKHEKLVGKSTLTEAWASLSSAVGVSARLVQAELATSNSVLTELNSQKQSVAGVNLNEEQINLQMFAQYYHANAQILKIATTLFDSLLAIR